LFSFTSGIGFSSTFLMGCSGAASIGLPLIAFLKVSSTALPTSLRIDS
jgi:hypothetical protein